MEIIRLKRNAFSDSKEQWHYLVVAEEGFSVLTNLCRSFGLDDGITKQFADTINQTNESGCLYPKAPISAIPRHFFRENVDSLNSKIITDFQDNLRGFFDANYSSPQKLDSPLRWTFL